MMIVDKYFDHMKILEKTMDALWLRNEAISNNIAHVDTPKFKRNQVNFESILKESLSGTTVKGKLTHEKHLALGGRELENIEPVVTKDFYTKYRRDGNNVNIDVETTNLSKNQIKYNAVAQRISQNLHKLKLVIKDGR